MFSKQRDMLMVLRHRVHSDMNPETTLEDQAYMQGMIDGFKICLDSLMPKDFEQELMQKVEAYIKEKNLNV